MAEPIDVAERRRARVREFYGAGPASRYEEVWQLNEVWAPEAEHYVATIGDLLAGAANWLDVGCGTGYFLSCFPDVDRAGIDLSPAMLERARAQNPSARELREGDISIDVPEWHGRWELVTSTGQAWGYLSTMDEIEQAAHNMAGWTAVGGTLMIQPPDLTDLSGHRLEYDFSGEPKAVGTAVITGAIWSYQDEQHYHQNQIWPSLDQWVGWLAHDFEHIEIFNWPHDPPPPYLPAPRRVLVARNRLAERSAARATIVAEPLPDPDPTPAAPDDAGPVVDDAAWASLKAHAEREQVRADAERARAERAEATATRLAAELAAANAIPAAAAEPAPAVTQPTDAGVGALAAEHPTSLYDLPLSTLVERYAPWRPRFWRGAKRRVDRLRSSSS